MQHLRDDALLDARLASLGITQNELARRAGISKTHLSYIRHRKRRVELDVAERIADLLGVPLHALFEPALPAHRRHAGSTTKESA